MAPLVPRVHFFEINDQEWFPSFLRAKVQDALALVWTTRVKPLQAISPANLAAEMLIQHLGDALPSHTYIDFCAGGGGPTVQIEKAVNAHLAAHDKPTVDFVLTDLFPNVEAWAGAAAKSVHISYVSEPVDASAVQAELVDQYKSRGKGVFRLFNLAFHHFDDPLAKAILKNTVETSEGFAIFELQDRTLDSLLSTFILGVGIFALAPYYAWKWRSPATLLFTYLIPILPFVLIFDGWISSLRTRTPEEVEALLRSCGVDAEGWEIKSGRTRHLWPCAYLGWIVCTKK